MEAFTPQPGSEELDSSSIDEVVETDTTLAPDAEVQESLGYGHEFDLDVGHYWP